MLLCAAPSYLYLPDMLQTFQFCNESVSKIKVGSTVSKYSRFRTKEDTGSKNISEHEKMKLEIQGLRAMVKDFEARDENQMSFKDMVERAVQKERDELLLGQSRDRKDFEEKEKFLENLIEKTQQELNAKLEMIEKLKKTVKLLEEDGLEMLKIPELEAKNEELDVKVKELQQKMIDYTQLKDKNEELRRELGSVL